MPRTPVFKYFDGVTEYDVWRTNFAFKPLSEAQRLSLVKACKSPTKDIDDKNREIARNLFECVRKADGYVPEPVAFDYPEAMPTEKSLAVYAVIQHREWSNEYRIRSRVDCPHRKPPLAGSKRASWILTSRGARKIAESCEYMSKVYGGYTTFLTLTFTQEQRERLASGKTTVQKEVSRFFDSMQKYYQRDGWADKMGCKTLAYCWVVEVPPNQDGEENPHCHVLMRWKVPHAEFKEWAARIESLWGNGFANLQKIKDHQASGAYMAKAAGYLSKAKGNEHQGLVRGNRYGISEVARAPGWITIDEKALHSMGMLIAEVSDYMAERHSEKFKLRRELVAKRDIISKSKTMSKEQIKKSKAIIGNKLAAVRKQINALPVRCSRYQIILKGKEIFESFIQWAKGKAINLAGREEWLPEAPAVAWDTELAPDIWSSRNREKPPSLWKINLEAAFRKKSKAETAVQFV